MGTWTVTTLLTSLGLVSTDFINDANVEYIVNVAISWVNAETGQLITKMTGSAVTFTDAQEQAVYPLITMMLRAYKDKGPNVGIGGLSVTSIVNDPQFTLFKDLFEKGCERLRGRSWLTT